MQAGTSGWTTTISRIALFHIEIAESAFAITGQEPRYQGKATLSYGCDYIISQRDMILGVLFTAFS